MVTPSGLTFRLRGCPASVAEAVLRGILSQSWGDVAPDDIQIRSLALSTWETPPTRTATLAFAKLPSVINVNTKKEWKLECPNLAGQLTLDTHFSGLTPLNDLDTQKHGFEWAHSPFASDSANSE
jgi:hypothetical protein